MTRRAFTLLETLVVLLILAMLAGAAGLKLSLILKNSVAREAASRIVSLDAKIRQDAGRHAKAIQLKCSLGGNTIWRLASDGSETPVAQLPNNWQIRRLIWADRHLDHGQAVLTYSPLGHSQSVVWILERSDGQRQILLLTGWTGQSIECADETHAIHLVQIAIDASGDDPH